MTALYDKYRPSTFDGVLGQDATVKSLKQALRDGRHHSFIFAGPSGTGKTTLARILAQELAHGKATNANIIAIPAADHTGVSDMRDVAARSNYRALGASAVKSFIIDECHRLSGSAWDVLLAPIEEPQAHVYWMFCTTNEGKIPHTIRTRCLTYHLKPVDEGLIIELLDTVAQAEKLSAADEVLEAIAEASGGSPRQALTFLEQCWFAATPNEARLLMRSGLQLKETVELARLLLARSGANWKAAIKIINSLKEVDAESIRIGVLAYLTGVLLKTQSEGEARKLLSLLEAFGQAYNPQDRMAPLLMSVGLALGLDQ